MTSQHDNSPQSASSKFNRREMLRGLGVLAGVGLASDLHAAIVTEKAPQSLVQIARANRVLFICLPGGPSQLDTFDYKPRLVADNGRAGRQPGSSLLRSPWTFSQHGESGQWISSLLPNLASHADDLCVIRSMQTSAGTHTEAMVDMLVGNASQSMASLGAQVVNALGSSQAGAAGFVAITPTEGFAGQSQLAEGRLPNHCRGARLGSEFHFPGSLKSLTTRETETTLQGYGIGNAITDEFGRKCLTARQLLEQGSRFVSVTHGSWDHHANLADRMEAGCLAFDRPLAGLLADLKSRGMLNDTLIVCSGEFGRTPHAEGTNGRDHQTSAFTTWLAGGGIRPGTSFGRTDEHGYNVVENPVTFADLHATILSLVGSNRSNGNGGKVIRQII